MAESRSAHHPVACCSELQNSKRNQSRGNGRKKCRPRWPIRDRVERFLDSAGLRRIVLPTRPREEDADHSENQRACANAETPELLDPLSRSVTCGRQIQPLEKLASCRPVELIESVAHDHQPGTDHDRPSSWKGERPIRERARMVGAFSITLHEKPQGPYAE